MDVFMKFIYFYIDFFVFLSKEEATLFCDKEFYQEIKHKTYDNDSEKIEYIFREIKRLIRIDTSENRF